MEQNISKRLRLNDYCDEVPWNIIIRGNDKLLPIDMSLYNACIYIQGYDYCFEELF